MADYTPIYQPGTAVTSQASATVTGGQVLIASGVGTVAPSSAASAAVVGVAASDAASGEKVSYYTGGVQEVTVVTATVNAGAVVEAATAGQVAPHTVGTNDAYMVGVALTTATVGNKAQVQFTR